MVKSKNIGWAFHAARMGVIRNLNTFLIAKPKEEKSLGDTLH
jgi:hypothetical protein